MEFRYFLQWSCWRQVILNSAMLWTKYYEFVVRRHNLSFSGYDSFLSLPVSSEQNQYLCKPSTHSLQLCRNYSFLGFHKGWTDLLTFKHLALLCLRCMIGKFFHLSIYHINILIIFTIFNNVQGWCQEEAITERGSVQSYGQEPL